MTQKEKAIELLKQLDIYKPYIEGFRKKKTTSAFLKDMADIGLIKMKNSLQKSTT